MYYEKEAHFVAILGSSQYGAATQANCRSAQPRLFILRAQE